MNPFLRHLRRAALTLTVAAGPIFAAAVIGATGTRFDGPAARRTSARRVALVVMVVVDQMRADYLDRFAAQYTGGLARLRHEGAVFRLGLQDHANTETAPGHSTVLSGREPVHTGIVSNAYGVGDPAAPLLEVRGSGASPHRFLGTELYDWMLVHDQRSRVLSVSRKDRAAILPVGRAKGNVYWYAGGQFTTSRYYRDSLPAWVRAFNVRSRFEALAGRTWSLLLPDSAYHEADARWFENGGRDVTFPHILPDSSEIRTRIIDYPWMDSLTLSFALDGVHALGLGRGPATDLLSISLSTTDAVGHAYGPDSREIHDQLLRVDRWLGEFLDSLATLAPKNETVVALTGDHGVTPYPEYLTDVEGQPGGRISLQSVAWAAGAELNHRFDVDFGIEFSTGLLMGDTAALHARGVDVDSLANALAAVAHATRGIAAAYTPRSLAAAPETDKYAHRWRRAIPASVAWLACIATEPGYVWSAGDLKAHHGTPNDDDVDVPIAFLGPGIPAHTYADTARTVDIAPTLADYLGIQPTEPLDGHALPITGPR